MEFYSLGNFHISLHMRREGKEGSSEAKLEHFCHTRKGLQGLHGVKQRVFFTVSVNKYSHICRLSLLEISCRDYWNSELT